MKNKYIPVLCKQYGSEWYYKIINKETGKTYSEDTEVIISKSVAEKICNLINKIVDSTSDEEDKYFTEAERTDVFEMQYKWKYFARDKNGELVAFTKKPYKKGDNGYWQVNNCEMSDYVKIGEIFKETFDSIQWEDEEPTSREEILGE